MLNENQIMNLEKIIHHVDNFCLYIDEWVDLMNQNLFKRLNIHPTGQREILMTGIFGIVLTDPKRTEIWVQDHCKPGCFKLPIVEFKHLIDKNYGMKKWSRNYDLNNNAEVTQTLLNSKKYYA